MKQPKNQRIGTEISAKTKRRPKSSRFNFHVPKCFCPSPTFVDSNSYLAAKSIYVARVSHMNGFFRITVCWSRTQLNMTNNLSFEEGWRTLESTINNAVDIIEDSRDNELTSEVFVNGYRIVYDVTRTIQCAKKFHEKYERTLKHYVRSKVLTQLWGKNGEILLKELEKRWNKYRTFQKWLSSLFQYLDGYYILSMGLPSLLQTSHLIFYDLVYGEMNDQVRRVLISEINRERNGEEIDQSLLRNVVEIYVKMADEGDSMNYYEKDFEKAMLEDTAQFYSRKASEWLIESSSYDDYWIKAGGCLNQEAVRVTNYLKHGSLDKLYKIVNHELFEVNARELYVLKENHKKKATPVSFYSSGAFILVVICWWWWVTK